MYDLLATFVNTNGLAFPNTAAVNSSGGGATDGTEFVKAFVDDIWGMMEDILDYTDDSPNGSSEVGASQILNSIKKITSNITEISSNTTHTVEAWNKRSMLSLETGCTIARLVGGTGANRSNRLFVYNNTGVTCEADYGASVNVEEIIMQIGQWIEFEYDDDAAKFKFIKSNQEIFFTKVADFTIGDWVPDKSTFIINPNTASQRGKLRATLPVIANNIGKTITFIYGESGNTDGGLIDIYCNGGTSNIRLDDSLIPLLYLYMPGNSVTLYNNGVSWGIKEKNIYLNTNLISQLIYSNSSIGLCKVNYKTKSANTTVAGMTVVETGGNANKMVVLYDSAPTGASGYILGYGLTSGTPAGQGVFANNATLTFSDGKTAAVDQGTGTNKNIASIIYHGLSVTQLKNFSVKMYLSVNSNESDSQEIPIGVNVGSSNGISIVKIDSNSFYAKSDSNGAGQAYQGASTSTLTSYESFFRIIMELI